MIDTRDLAEDLTADLDININVDIVASYLTSWLERQKFPQHWEVDESGATWTHYKATWMKDSSVS